MNKVRTGSALALPRALKLFLAVSVVLNAVAVFCAALAYKLRLPGLYRSLPNNVRGWDLTGYLDRFWNIHTFSFFYKPDAYAYPPAVAPFYVLFLKVSQPTAVFELLVAGIFVAAACFLGLQMRGRGASNAAAIAFPLLSLVLAYPVAFEWRQCNMEIFTFVLLAIGVWAHVQRRNTVAAICIGLAGAMKLSPYMFVGLFLSKRQIKPIIVVLVTGVLVTVVCLAYLTPSIVSSYRGVSMGLQSYRNAVFLQTTPEAVGWDHSVFTLIKLMTDRFHPTFHQKETLLRLYMVGSAAIGIYLYFWRIQYLPTINQVLCLSLACTFLPPSSFDYTLMTLYIPWAMLVALSLRARFTDATEGLTRAFLCLAVMLSAETELILHARGYGGQVKACAFFVLFAIALRHPFTCDEWSRAK